MTPTSVFSAHSLASGGACGVCRDVHASRLHQRGLWHSQISAFRWTFPIVNYLPGYGYRAECDRLLNFFSDGLCQM